MWLVNLSGKPSVKLGIPYPVFATSKYGSPLEQIFQQW